MARSITTRSTNPKIMDDNIKILDDTLASASTPEAENVVYDNTDSGLSATNVNAAIDEVFDELNNNVGTALEVISERAQIMDGGLYIRGNMAFINVKIKALITASNSPAILLTASYQPARDTVLMANDITSGGGNVGVNVPTCISNASGYNSIYLKEVITDHIYQISGWYLLN